MDSSTVVSPQDAAQTFQIDSLDDPGDDEALDRAFGTESEVFSTAVMARRENHPPTTQREVWGWYLYEAANQPYSRYVNLA